MIFTYAAEKSPCLIKSSGGEAAGAAPVARLGSLQHRQRRLRAVRFEIALMRDRRIVEVRRGRQK